MSSPFRASNHSSSSPRSTPSRTVPNGVRRLNGYHRSSLNSPVADSPSHQLLEEFGRMLINDERSFKRSLDEQTAAQQRLHLQALDRALAKHEEVRESADRVREQVELELERERRRRDEEEKKAIERARKELEEQKIEEERRRLEEAKAREEERRQKEQLKRDEEAFERQKKETSRREQEEARQRDERRKKEEEAKKLPQPTPANSGTPGNGLQSLSTANQTSSMPAAPKPQPNGVAPAHVTSSSKAQAPSAQTSADSNSGLPSGLFTDMQQREAIHNQYLDLHKRLKQMREHVLEECKKVPGLKNQVSDWRRAIVKCCGQMGKGTSDKVKQANRRAIQEIQNHLDAAVNVAEPSIDITQYIVENKQPPNANARGPAVLLFLLNHFAKGVIKQLISESSVDPKSADAIGVLAVTIFARPQYLFNGQSLIDILWAKYHVHCPILFGISGSEKTKAGRLRLGWEFDAEAGVFTKDQVHYDRMAGLGAGFASITLRDFSKSKNANPAPNRIWWQAVARIVNTRAAEVQPSHFVVLRAIIAQDISRILKCFGGAGMALLRAALITFPTEKGPQDDKGNKIAAVNAVQALPAVLQRDFQLAL